MGQSLKASELKECERELRAVKGNCSKAKTIGSWAKEGKMPQVHLEQGKANEAVAFSSQLHDARIIAGLQAYVSEEAKALEQTEAAYNIVLAGVAQYARAKLELSFEGDAVVKNKRMRQAVNQRYRVCFK